jgi:hypothetical protein
MTTVGGSRCSRCGDDKAPVRAPRLAWAVIPLVWTALILLGACSALLLPANLLLVPCWLAVGSSVGTLARELLDPKCGRCGANRGSSSASRSAYVTRRPSGPTDERAMKGGLVGEA